MNLIASTIEKEHLFNIANGIVALDETVDFLNNAWTIGFSARECFIKDCNDVQTPTRTQLSNKRSRILLLKLVVTKCRAKAKASFW